ncbi:hypothetical protein (mitochondrion) [Myxobolus squamalis]|uniref:Uncharacterized protein n=1 Tax=Myxobolus squamalis TaxID=59785 RepID=A0A678XII0_MYXSQ|nr:hypothetical protein [Myxobolus squamalis]
MKINLIFIHNSFLLLMISFNTYMLFFTIEVRLLSTLEGNKPPIKQVSLNHSMFNTLGVGLKSKRFLSTENTNMSFMPDVNLMEKFIERFIKTMFFFQLERKFDLNLYIMDILPETVTDISKFLNFSNKEINLEDVEIWMDRKGDISILEETINQLLSEVKTIPKHDFLIPILRDIRWEELRRLLIKEDRELPYFTSRLGDLGPINNLILKMEGIDLEFKSTLLLGLPLEINNLGQTNIRLMSDEIKKKYSNSNVIGVQKTYDITINLGCSNLEKKLFEINKFMNVSMDMSRFFIGKDKNDINSLFTYYKLRTVINGINEINNLGRYFISYLKTKEFRYNNNYDQYRDIYKSTMTESIDSKGVRVLIPNKK